MGANLYVHTYVGMHGHVSYAVWDKGRDQNVRRLASDVKGASEKTYLIVYRSSEVDDLPWAIQEYKSSIPLILCLLSHSCCYVTAMKHIEFI